VLREELDGKLESHKHNFEERLLTRSVLCQPKFRCQMDLQKKSIFGTEPAAFGGTCFFFAIPISYLFYATQHAPGGNKLWKSAARVCSRLQHWLEICNSVWVKLVDCHGLHKATDPCNFRYVLRVISMYLSTDQFWANSFDPYSAFRKASYIILHHFTIFYLVS
jgi:hypothetical protein